MKKDLKQLIKVAILIILPLTFLAAKPARVDETLDGTWELDTAASDFGGLPVERAAAATISLSQKDGKITISRTIPNLTTPAVEVLNLDGKEQEVPVPGATVTRNATISKDGASLTVLSKYKVAQEGGDPVEYGRMESYTLSDEKDEMLLQRETVLPNGGKEIVKAIYHRQNN